MNKEIKAKWLAALRSGEYRQIKHKLRNKGKGRCCLGVLADVNGAEWTKKNGCFVTQCGPPRIQFPDADTYYGQGTRLDEHTARRLAEMNDNGASFAKIADWIEENL